jgi:hypothetical protein
MSEAKYDSSDREAQLFISHDLITKEGMSGAPVFNAEGECFGMLCSGSAEFSGVIPVNVMWEALGMKNHDHPDGFSTGITVGFDYHTMYSFEEMPPTAPAPRLAVAGRHRRAGPSVKKSRSRRYALAGA